MASKKSERDRELHEQRGKAIEHLRLQVSALCDSHIFREIGKMNETLDRMLATIVELRDPQPNDEKRTTLLKVLEAADAGSDPADIIVTDSSQVESKVGASKLLFVRGDFDMDKLVSSVVWLKPAPVLDLEEIKPTEGK